MHVCACVCLGVFFLCYPVCVCEAVCLAVCMCMCACVHKCVRLRACERGAVCVCDVAHVDMGKRATHGGCKQGQPPVASDGIAGV